LKSTPGDRALYPTNVPLAVDALDAAHAKRDLQARARTAEQNGAHNFDAAFASTFCLHASLRLPLVPVTHGDEIVNNIIHYFVKKHVDIAVPVAIQG
jgi:hypothetical protein